ncbi:MAG: DUF3857 domain-containing protein, partial [Candidatus Nanoarchaeia archaeon]
MKKLNLFIFVSLCLALFSSFASEKNFPLISRDEVLEIAKSANIEEYPDADSILLFEHEFTRYNKDGTSEMLDESYVKILTEKGRRELTARNFYYHTVYEAFQIASASILKSDGTIIKIDIPANTNEMIAPSQMGANIYDPNFKQITLNIPGLEIGDIVHVAVSEKTIKARMPNTWSGLNTMEDEAPILKYVIEVSAPVALPLLHRAIRDEIKGTVSYEEQKDNVRTLHRWTVKNVPQMFPEPNMPSPYSVVQRLLLSTIKDWRDVSKWYWGLCVPHLEATTPEMKAKVEELCQQKNNDMEKIEAIFYFVSQNIRYMGITTEKDAPGYEPHDVKITFENKYGVCRDKAALLVAMLRLAGLKAFPVLIMAGPKKDAEVPNPYFNHAIVCVDLSKNEEPNYVLMDPTDENTKDLLPSYLCDKSYLAARPEGDILRTSPIVPAEQNMLEINTEAYVGSSGIMLAETKLNFGGINDGVFRGHFARMKQEDRRRSFESLLKKIMPNAFLVELELIPEDLRNTSIPLEARLKYFSEDVLTEGPNAFILEMPWFGTQTGVVNFVLGSTGLEKRKYPLETDIACGTEEKITIKFDDQLKGKWEIPAFMKPDNELFTWQRDISLNNNILKGNTCIKLKTVRFSPEEYLQLKEFLKDTEYEARKKPFFIKEQSFDKSNEATQDVIVLKDSRTFEQVDEQSIRSEFESVKKILSYAGKKRNSEIKISYNPVWDEVKIEHAKVIAPDGSIKELSPEETNIMDQAWVSSARRYPPGKILVASLPGVEPGSIIEFKCVQIFRKRPFISFISYLQGNNPVLESSISVINAKGKLKEMNTASLNIEKINDEKQTTWMAKNVPALKNEKNLPPLFIFTPCIAFSNGSWREYAEQLDYCLKNAAKNANKATAKAIEICEGITDKKEKIRKIRDFVAINIRSAGPSFNDLPLDNITDADRTLSDGYGNSADKAVLIYAMLSAQGINSEFVLASSYPQIKQISEFTEEIPFTNVFQEVLVKIAEENIYLNDTNQYAELGVSSNNGMTGLALPSGKLFEIKSQEEMDD